MHLRIAICLLVCTFYGLKADVDIITEPRPGEEYVLVSSGQQTPLRTFETSHKIPEKHPQHHVIRPEDTNGKINKKLHSGKVKYPTEGIVSIEEDKKASFGKKGQKNKVAESIEIDVPVSKIEDIKIRENVKDIDTNPKMAVDLDTISESGKLTDNPGTTTQKPVLTTSATTKGYDYIPINFDSIDDINSGLLSSNAKLETAGSEQKQHSRIQIKKGPNGQDYEYEYIYYYYDEDEEGSKKETKEKSTTTVVPVHNAHDGPQKAEHENQIIREGKSKYSSIDRTTSTTAPTPEIQNEVLPTTSRSRQRGRPAVPAPVEEEIEENRLPSSTRFPPRGRQLAVAAASSTTHAPQPAEPVVRSRGRSSADNVADESIGQTRSRTRAHLRRPSSELVDLDSFKTHSGDIPSQYKEPPSRYSTESKSTTESQEIATEKDIAFVKETPREGHSISSVIRFQEILDDSKLPADYKRTTTYEPETTEYTTMTAMEKVALDLYAYLAGENLNNEINPTNELPGFEGSTTVEDVSTTDVTTEEVTTTTSTTPVPTTTTTTTTQATTTTTTTTAAPTRPSRFKGRPLARGRASTSTEAPTPETSTRARGRFGKPSGGRKSTTAASSEPVTTAAPVEKPAQPKNFGRRGLFGGRTRQNPSTAAPAQDVSPSSVAASEPSSPRPRLRPNLRRTTSTTAASVAPSGEDAAASSSNPDQAAETTPAPQGSRTIGRSRPNLRPAPLRPGARLNIRANPRLRGGASTAAPETASEVPAETSAPESAPTEQQQQEAETSQTPVPEAPRNKLRNRLQVSPSPRPRVSVTAPARRQNPLLKRKQLSTEATTEATKKPTEVTEESTSAEKVETETEAQPAETTPTPPLRGLDALLARRRASGGIGARPSRPVRGVIHPK